MNTRSDERLPRPFHRTRRGGALIALLAALSFVFPMLAQATPSQDDIDQARSEENAAKMSVAQIEVALATVTAQAQQATQDAQAAGEELNEAKLALQAATDTATKAKADADKAQADYDAGRKDLASIAQAAYRDGGSSLDVLTPYLESDGLQQVAAKQSAMDTVSAQTAAKMQRVAALEQVASIMKEASDTALAAQQQATDEVQAKQQAAQAKADAATALQNQTDARRQVLVEELATRENTTASLIQEREAALEAARQEAARKAAEAAAQQAAQQAAAQQAAQQAASRPVSRPSTGSSSGSSSSGSTSSGSTSSGSSSSGSTAPSGSSGSSSSHASSSGSAAGAIASAKSLLGSPYVWSGEGPGYDCSGLTTVAYRSQGVRLTHFSQAQYTQGTHVPVGSAQPGDLVFWSSNGTQSGIFHVAMYLGNNQIIEAPTFGIPVRITTMYSWGKVMPYATRVV